MAVLTLRENVEFEWAGAGRVKYGCSLGGEQGSLAGAHPAWWSRGRDRGEDKGRKMLLQLKYCIRPLT